MLFWEREEEEEIGVHFYLNIKRNLMQYSSTYKTSQQLLAEEKNATAMLRDESMSDSSFVIHYSKEHLLCNKIKSFKNISHL